MMKSRFMQGKVVYLQDSNEILNHLDLENSYLIYDLALEKIKTHKKLIQKFHHKKGFQSGEKLKNLSHFTKHAKNLVKSLEAIPRKKLCIVAFGGGSLGDFAGFFASVYHRGVPFVQIPSTWLAAVDSAHGGKNALNLEKYKNQIGTYHFPSKTLICRQLLPSQPERLLEAAGEIVKASFLDLKLRKRILNCQKLDHANLGNLLKPSVDLKLKIVSLDPYEKKKIRYALNLGHSLGHALELDQKLPHGIAVLIGVEFAIVWSYHRGLLSKSDFEQIKKSSLCLAIKFLKSQSAYKKISLEGALQKSRRWMKIIRQDKKRNSFNEIDEVFLTKRGFLVESTGFDAFEKEIERQKLEQSSLF